MSLVVVFQSHAGSIEALMGEARRRELGLAFQSHAGSIEATDLEVRDYVAFLRFNPTLVRLRPSTGSTREPERRIVSIPRWFD